MMRKLTDEERAAGMAALPHWTWDETRDGIGRGFRFADFNAAFAFMARVARLADAQDHHPEWSNVWNRVDIFLTTHDAGGLTQRDIDLAEAIDSLA